MPAYPIQSVERALDILEYIVTQHGAGVSEIARALNLNKSTAFGLIKTLEAKGYIYKLENDTYHVTLHLHSLAGQDVNAMAIVGYAQPYLEELLRKYGETVHLVRADANSVTYLVKLEGTKSIRVSTQVGATNPLYSTGVGKAILSTRSPAEVEDYLSNQHLLAFTPNTITDTDALNAELDKVRRQGYSLDNEEMHRDLFCVAAPIRDNQGRGEYAISISLPRYRAEKQLIEQMAADVMAAAKAVGAIY